MPDLSHLLPEWLQTLSESLLTISQEVYLVGGAVRNLLSEREVQDYDFVVKKKSIQAARYAADHLGGDFYILDQERKTARAIIPLEDKVIHLDFALFNGENIDADLKARDFTINAMAIPFPEKNHMIDPTGGEGDLANRLLCPCSETSFLDDPVRAIRYIRFKYELGLTTKTSDEEAVKKAVPFLSRVSKERQRDALMRVIAVSNARDTFNEMLKVGLITQIFPGAEKLVDVELSLPHTHNAWDHTMQVVFYCQQIMMAFGLAPTLPDIHPRIHTAVNRLKLFQKHLYDFFTSPLSSDVNRYQLLILSALFHDLAKGDGDHAFKGNRKKYPGHAKRGAKLIREWAKSYHFSNKETSYLFSVVRTHMKVSRPEMIAPDTRNVNIFRFFKRTGEAGVLTAILHLADVLTTYEDALTDERWDEALTAVTYLLDAYFLQYHEIINPPLLLDGQEIIREFDLHPGKLIGDLLSSLQEAQVAGEVVDRQQALIFLNEQLAKEEQE